jgi:hypothetical protein
MGRKRRQGNSTSQKNNSIEDLVGNEENEYQGPDPNRMMMSPMRVMMSPKSLSKRK